MNLEGASKPLDRRSFLARGSLAGALALAPAGVIKHLATEATFSDGPLSVGFVSSPELIARLREEPPTEGAALEGIEVVPLATAARARYDSPKLSKVRVFGLTSLSTRLPSRVSELHLRAVPAGNSAPSVHLWSCTTDPVLDVSAGTSMVTTSSSLILEVISISPVERLVRHVALGSPAKGLRRGSYLLGFRPRVWDRRRTITVPGSTDLTRNASLVLSVEDVSES